jgi:outer membrane lipoprotein-sorting protein
MRIFIILSLTSLPLWAQFLPDSFKANYEERYLSATQNKEKKSNGVIHYQHPRKLRFEVIKPDPALFISNPQNSWYYTPPFIEGEEGQVVIQEPNKLILIKLLDVLRQGLVDNKFYKVKKENISATLFFNSPYEKEFKMDKVILHSFKKMAEVTNIKDLSELDLFYQNGQKVTLGFSQFESPVTFAADHFVFKVPPKTKVTKESP